MTQFLDSLRVYKALLTPTKFFGFPNRNDRIEALKWIKENGHITDLHYHVYPLVFDNDNKIATEATNAIVAILKRVNLKQWNNIYDSVKYANVQSIEKLLKFSPEISAHLVGIASLNSNGFVREKALRVWLLSDNIHSNAIPYIILRLSDWVEPVRAVAINTLKSVLNTNNINALIENWYLINTLDKKTRVDLRIVKNEIIEYLRDEECIRIVKAGLKHQNVKSRLFSYEILENTLPKDESIVDLALKDKSYEIRLWVLKMSSYFETEKRNFVILKLLSDKSAKVKVKTVRMYSEFICTNHNNVLISMLYDSSASVREEVRYMVKKYDLMDNILDFYKHQLTICVTSGVILGIGEIGSIDDFSLIEPFVKNTDNKIRLAALISMSYLSKKDVIRYLVDGIQSDIQRVRKISKLILKKEKDNDVLIILEDVLAKGSETERIIALEIIESYGKWEALYGIIYSILNFDGQTFEVALKYLNSWLNGVNHYYTKPNDSAKNIVIDNIERLQKLLPEAIFKQIKFVLNKKMQ